MKRLRSTVLACILVVGSTGVGVALTRTACLSRQNTVSFYDRAGAHVADVRIAHRYRFPAGCKRVRGWGGLDRISYYRQKIVEEP
jgi:hypothetical protein